MPVVMLTSSAEERDIVASYFARREQLHRQAGRTSSKFVDEVAKAGCYWVLVNRLPGRRAGRA